MVGVVPSMVGAAPSMVGVIPSMVGAAPSMVGVARWPSEPAEFRRTAHCAGLRTQEEVLGEQSAGGTTQGTRGTTQGTRGTTQGRRGTTQGKRGNTQGTRCTPRVLGVRGGGAYLQQIQSDTAVVGHHDVGAEPCGQQPRQPHTAAQLQDTAPRKLSLWRGRGSEGKGQGGRGYHTGYKGYSTGY